MRRVMVRYTVKPDGVATNERLVGDVYAALAAAQPAGFHYATFKLDDGVGFVHLARHEDGANPLAELPAFGRFQEGLRERCDSPPVVTELSEVGSYRFFGEMS
jgi:hypothetical protein